MKTFNNPPAAVACLPCLFAILFPLTAPASAGQRGGSNPRAAQPGQAGRPRASRRSPAPPKTPWCRSRPSQPRAASRGPT